MTRLSIQRTLALTLLSLAPLALLAQQDGRNGPPKILVIQREYIKPGKSGMAHQKTESTFVQALTAAKSHSYYVGVDSLTGPNRSLFLFGYTSLEAWQKDLQTTRNNPTLAAAIDRAYSADGDLLTSAEQNVYALRDDLSLNNGNLVNMRYMEFTQFLIRPGHYKEFQDLAKLYVEGYKKAVPNAHWSTFELTYGANTGALFIVVTPLKSLTEADQEMADAETFSKAMGEDGNKQLAELSAASIQATQTNLFEINPKISYPTEEWIKAEPEFWTPKPTPTTKKPQPKPAQ